MLPILREIAVKITVHSVKNRIKWVLQKPFTSLAKMCMQLDTGLNTGISERRRYNYIKITQEE